MLDMLFLGQLYPLCFRGSRRSKAGRLLECLKQLAMPITEPAQFDVRPRNYHALPLYKSRSVSLKRAPQAVSFHHPHVFCQDSTQPALDALKPVLAAPGVPRQAITRTRRLSVW